MVLWLTLVDLSELVSEPYGKAKALRLFMRRRRRHLLLDDSSEAGAGSEERRGGGGSGWAARAWARGARAIRSAWGYCVAAARRA